MNKYDPLRELLTADGRVDVTVEFSELNELLPGGLPQSAPCTVPGGRTRPGPVTMSRCGLAGCRPSSRGRGPAVGPCDLPGLGCEPLFHAGPRFLKLGDVAEGLHITAAQTHALVQSGAGAAIKIGGPG